MLVDYQKGARFLEDLLRPSSPRARRSRMPVSPSDLLSFCVGDFITSG